MRTFAGTSGRSIIWGKWPGIKCAPQSSAPRQSRDTPEKRLRLELLFEALAGGSIHFECDAAVGVALGVPTILAVSPALDHFLAPGWAVNFVYGTHPNDPRTIALSVLVLTGTAVLAGYVPARRASRVDPAIALRHE